MKVILAACCVIALLLPSAVNSAVVTVRADGKTRPYDQFDKALGATAYEVPDCAHKTFGDHITQQNDGAVGRQVFAFHIHTNSDNDRCEKFDRQRVEVKTYSQSPAYLKAQNGDTVAYSWHFKLPTGFKASADFTHIHQVKFDGGNDGQPVYAISLVKKNNGDQVIRYVHTGNNDVKTVLWEALVAPYLGHWIHVYEKIKFGTSGTLEVEIRKFSDNSQIWKYTNAKIDNWRTGTSFCRPKWGVYRGLGDKGSLREETVLFDRFCLAKGTTDDCEKKAQ